MDDHRKQIRDQINALVSKGVDLLRAELAESKKSKRSKAASQEAGGGLKWGYQSWYSEALPIVKQLLPERYEEFRECYKDDKRKAINVLTYRISDYLSGFVQNIGYPPEPAFDTLARAADLMTRQIQILRSAEDRIDSLLGDITGSLQADLFDDELAVASALLKQGHLRAAGAVSGVVIERHLARTAANHAIKLRKKTPTIADLNDPLKESAVYDLPTWRQIQHLADIRNLCVHSKDRDPTKDEVQALIDGAGAIV
jgi:hypothetical protein